MQENINKHNVQNSEILALLKYAVDNDAKQESNLEKLQERMLSAPQR